MKMLILTYPKLEMSIQAVITPAKTEEIIRKEWKHKYGKLLEKCTIVFQTNEVPPAVINPINPTIRHIPSGRVFMSVRSAARCMGVSKFKIRHHINKKLKIRVTYEYELIEQTA